MLTNEQYVTRSLELNLFFLRIIKEHALFAAASLPPKDSRVSMQFVATSRNFEKLLSRTLSLANGNISKEAMTSGELITSYTMPAERSFQFLTGIPVDTSITAREMSSGFREYYGERAVAGNISMLNREIIAKLNATITFQNNLLNEVMSCRAFGYVYPSNLKHVTEEARAYLEMLIRIENRQEDDNSIKGLIQKEGFWNDLMHEHAEFIRGYLDPHETKLFNTANSFAEKLGALHEATNALAAQPSKLNEVTKASQELVTELRNFKRQGTEGLLSCKIKAIMPALLADHVTREANYYLRLLRASNT